ncbi:anthranilate synthase component II [Tropheryma whipplei]|uniref:anthranilate synthase component II n=1 Tax=Tropheryma whipplei TaxID=2039 RepID=UPI000000C75D|nr:aminodeoxychorismate/anthranilate synthase component II [Tropheryma whipplei]MCO8182821.1 aminodeoxychorismate/anthranilate synthase component II [Tropheryma whipplei]MCO8190501.1 aminodeoxychorismate/anthranilate synthase component II [Tropheryma whipplei]CAD66703.1 putative glutamine amidotransferase [Tropheryma whipplei TW08/27]
MFKVLVIDNHDSFIYTLVNYLQQLGVTTSVVRSDNNCHSVESMLGVHDAALISPGPGTPEESGITLSVIRAAYSTSTPLLGVCLGHQALAVAFGGDIGPSGRIMHGKLVTVRPRPSAIFKDLPTAFTATRYNSLTVTKVPQALRVIARADCGEVMALEHRTAPMYGVQFHPESAVSEWGFRILGNWLYISGFNKALGISRDLPIVVYNTRVR